MTIQETPVTFTNGIPICPYCNKGTKRTAFGGIMTIVGMSPEFNEQGFSVGPNTNIQIYHCAECSKYYGVATRMNVSEYYECKQP